MTHDDAARNARRSILWSVLIFAVGLAGLSAAGWTFGAGPLEEPRIAGHAHGTLAPVFRMLATLGVVILVGRVLIMALAYVKQPPVIGDILAGVALGPSLLGRFWPEAHHFLAPPEVLPALGVLAWFGVSLYMFLVGLDFDSKELKGHGGTVLAVAAACLLLPLLFGAGSALFLHSRYGLQGVSFPALALFLGVATAVTAFPMLARLLIDRGMDQTTLGRVAIGAAALDDGIAWCLFAMAVGILEAAPGRAALSVLSAVAFAVGLLFVARPLLARWLRNRHEPPTQGTLALVFAGMLACIVTAELVGVNAVFGAFLWGFVIPRESGLAQQLVTRLRDVVTALLLPAFFAYSGMRTDLGLAFAPAALGWAVLVIVLATAGKLGGGYWASRACGLPRSDALIVGALMNTRALMELIALNIGLEICAISRTVFAMFVLMAIATTMMTGPLVDLAQRRRA